MKILREVLSLPTAPFHEEKVARYIEKFCVGNGFRLKRDRSGNLFVRYKRGKAGQKVVFTAHMDHPGFEVIKSGKDRTEAGILGGINLDYFKGAAVSVMTSEGVVKGKISRKKLNKKWMKKPAFEIEFKEKDKKKVRVGDFGWYDLVPFRLDGDLIYTKSADNLASAAVLLELLACLKRKRKNVDVTCLFTRAEEVGFIGCAAFANANILSSDVPVIVVECSSAASGGIKIGAGPVIRVGDKMTSYDSGMDRWLSNIAGKISSKDKKFRFQRALLAGGTCEASLWTLRRRPAGGLAFPLGNYHNNGKRGYAPEFISRDDYKNMLELLREIAVSGKFMSAFDPSKATLNGIYNLWRKRLQKRTCSHWEL